MVQRVFNPKSKWQRLRRIVKGIESSGSETTTWRRRYPTLQKVLARALRRTNFNEIRVLDLGSGIVNGVSPLSESFFRYLSLNKLKVGSYVAVDKRGENSRKKGIAYVKSDLLDFIKKADISKPNVIVSLNVMDWLMKDSRKKAGEFARLCWEKLPEKGFLATDVYLRLGIPGGILGERFLNVPIVVRKVNGSPQIVYTRVRSDLASFLGFNRSFLIKKLSEGYPPKEYYIDIASDIDELTRLRLVRVYKSR